MSTNKFYLGYLYIGLDALFVFPESFPTSFESSEDIGIPNKHTECSATFVIYTISGSETAYDAAKQQQRQISKYLVFFSIVHNN